MKTIRCVTLITFLTCTLVNFPFAQSEESGVFQGYKFKTSLNFEYFSRTIKWEEEESTSTLKSYLFMLDTEYEVNDWISLHAILGYSPSNFENLIFRELPFSVELEAGNIGGLLLGGGLDLNITEISEFEIGAKAQFVYYLGREKDWDIPGLSVSGTVTGKPAWTRLIIGPVLTYKALGDVYPYLFPAYNRLGGTFTMKQSIESLTGSEKKKISSDGNLNFTLGAGYEPSDRFGIRVELNLIPTSSKVDFGFLLGLAISY